MLMPISFLSMQEDLLIKMVILRVIESQRGEINRALAEDEQFRRDQHFLHEQLLTQNRELREAHEKSMGWKN